MAAKVRSTNEEGGNRLHSARAHHGMARPLKAFQRDQAASRQSELPYVQLCLALLHGLMTSFIGITHSSNTCSYV